MLTAWIIKTLQPHSWQAMKDLFVCGGGGGEKAAVRGPPRADSAQRHRSDKRKTVERSSEFLSSGQIFSVKVNKAGILRSPEGKMAKVSSFIGDFIKKVNARTSDSFQTPHLRLVC